MAYGSIKAAGFTILEKIRNSIKMIKFASILILGLAAFSFSCSSLNLDEVSLDSDSMDIETLLSQSKTHNGKPIKVFGYYHLEDDLSVLFPDRKAYVESDYSHAIQVGRSSETTPDLHRPNHSYIYVEGMFQAGATGMFDIFAGKIEPVTAFEKYTASQK